MPSTTKPAKAAKPSLLSARKPRDDSSSAAPPPKKAKAAAKVAEGVVAPPPTPAASSRSKKSAAAERVAVEAQETAKDMAAETGAPKKAARKAGAKAIATPAGAKGISLPTLKSKGKAKAPTLPSKESAAPPTKDLEEDEEAEEAASAAGSDDGDDSDADVHLHGFSSDDEDSSDDDDDGEAGGPDIPGIDVARLPTIAKDDATVKRRLDRAKKEKSEERGVLYLGRIPHGFYEAEMRAYFSQFGDVTRVRISRNKKTGASKHYGFVEMGSRAVAAIVAETMDNYLLAGHILRCKLIPTDQVRPELWVGANRTWRKVPRDRVARVAHNKNRTEGERAKAEDRLLRRQEDKKRKLGALGIDYDFGEAGYKKSRPAVSSVA